MEKDEEKKGKGGCVCVCVCVGRGEEGQRKVGGRRRKERERLSFF